VLPDVVNAVVGALAPEKVAIGGERERTGRMQFEGGVQINVVEWSDKPRLAEVSAFREKRIEGLQVAVVGIAVAARRIGFQAETGRPWGVRECEAGIAGGRPRGNVSIAELAELIHELEIPIPARVLSPQPRANRVAHFPCCALIETRRVALQAQVVEIHFATGHRLEG